MRVLATAMRSLRPGLVVIATALSLFLPSDAPRAAAAPLELAVKATYLYKLVPFVEWPATAFATPSSEFNLCVVGDDPFGDLLDRAVTGQRAGEHPIVVRRSAQVSPGCHILYAAGSPAQPVRAILDTVRGAPVLTVTDQGREDAKGIINFIVQENKVRFEIDDRVAMESGLAISSKLLSLAVNVRPRS